jgi:hypothetical protein
MRYRLIYAILAAGVAAVPGPRAYAQQVLSDWYVGRVLSDPADQSRLV